MLFPTISREETVRSVWQVERGLHWAGSCFLLVVVGIVQWLSEAAHLHWYLLMPQKDLSPTVGVLR